MRRTQCSRQYSATLRTAAAQPVGRTPFGNKNLKNNELDCKPAFENRE